MLSRIWVKRIATAIDEVVENALDTQNMYDYHQPAAERLDFLYQKLEEEAKSGRNPKTAGLRLRSISRRLPPRGRRRARASSG